jgi:hypothetical protein
VEVWGPIDANHYFYIGDAVLPGPPAPPGTPRISIFYFNGVSSAPYILHDQVRDALNASFENIDAFEAIPEPGGLGLLASALGLLLGHRLRAGRR